ncbi:MAG: insulinase family protein [Acidobacteria bacterium]|nr:insulinase family protein [Acidobacteriota bacterium]
MKRIAFLIPALLAAPLTAQQAFTLPNGMQVRLFEDHSLPLVQGELRLALPPAREDGEAWLRPFGFRLLAEGGSGSRTAAAFAQAADALGLDLRLARGPLQATWTFAARSQDQEAALGLLADRVTRPVFDPLALEPARLQAWSDLTNADALARARLRFARSLEALPLPAERDLASVDPARLAAWHRRLFRPDRATLVLWGDLDLAQARQLAVLSFGAWPAATSPETPLKPAAPDSGPFLAALPGEAPVVSIGLVADGVDAPQRRFLWGWMDAQLQAAGLQPSREEDDGAVSLRVSGPLGTAAETLHARLAGALDALPKALTAESFAAWKAQAAQKAALAGLHPGQRIHAASAPTEAPADLDAAKAVLTRWCAETNRRLFASGDPGALQGLQASAAATPNR